MRNLIEIGLKRFDISIVVENVWKDGDDKILESQLISLADYLFDNGIEDDVYISAFEYNIGQPQDLNETARPCGGMTMAIDSEGNIYNCLRFSQFALTNKKARLLGNIFSDYKPNRMRPLLSMDYYSAYPDQCKQCGVATGCKICPAESYDSSFTGSIFDRSTAICKMHKAKVRAKNYYWNKYHNLNRK